MLMHECNASLAHGVKAQLSRYEESIRVGLIPERIQTSMDSYPNGLKSTIAGKGTCPSLFQY